MERVSIDRQKVLEEIPVKPNLRQNSRQKGRLSDMNMIKRRIDQIETDQASSGLSFDQFSIVRELGRGSYGVVYLVKFKSGSEEHFVLKKIKF
jgi:serine/threonine protein kinase